MEKKEKVEFILEQMRLCLAKRDFVRTQIISKKINTKYFEEADVHVSYLDILFSASLSVSIASISSYLSPSPSVGLCVCVSVSLSVWKVFCGKMADCIQILFGMVSGVG